MASRTKKERKWTGSEPTRCDICGLDFIGTFIDGKTLQGPWGLLCTNCHRQHGVGLGVGRGQEYDLETKIKLAG